MGWNGHHGSRSFNREMLIEINDDFVTALARTLRRQNRPGPSAGRNAKNATATDMSVSEVTDASNVLAMLREEAVPTEAAVLRSRSQAQRGRKGSTRPTE